MTAETKTPILYYAINVDGTVWAKSTDYESLRDRLQARNEAHAATTDKWLGGWIQSWR